MNALMIFMALDYITGVMRAIIDKKLYSAFGFKDVCKKELILFKVGIANIVDLHVIGSGSPLRGALIAFYLSNEGLSLLENAAYIGMRIPDKLKAVLEQLHDRDKEEGKDDQGDGETAAFLFMEVTRMSEKINTPFTNEHFTDWCLKMVGQLYWYGTCVYKATSSLLTKKTNQYPLIMVHPGQRGTSKTSPTRLSLPTALAAASATPGQAMVRECWKPSGWTRASPAAMVPMDARQGREQHVLLGQVQGC